MSCNHPRKKNGSMMAVAIEDFLTKMIGDKQRYFGNIRYVRCLQIEPVAKRADIALS